MNYRDLLDKAIEITEKAYAPYSKVHVGAAILTESGEVFQGVNVENASFGATNCAERTAIFSAITAGHTKFKAIAVASNLDHPISPCGICRQVILEYGNDIDVILGDENDYKVYTIAELVPVSFTKDEI